MNTSQLSAYLSAQRNADGSFNFSDSSKASFLATSFGVMTDFLLNGADKLDYREDTISYLNSGFGAKGGFADPAFNISELTGTHQADYMKAQIAYFSLIAADVLGNRHPGAELIFSLKEENISLDAWFAGLDLGHFWYESNKIMFMLYFLFYEWHYTGSEKAMDMIKQLMNLLNQSQDPSTGFWGTDKNGNNLLDGCFGTAHVLLFYDFLDMEIPYAQKMIDNTLGLHHPNGLIRRKNGGACEDYDAIEIYLRCARQTNYRKADIERELVKMKGLISGAQASNGGFAYKIEESGLKRLVKSTLMPQHYTYSGWARMKTCTYKSDLWGTWFRVLSLKVIDYLLEGKTDFHSYWLPAWGYIKK
ncbi:MAG: hypothetical protein ACK5JD_07865 [Mangrovibacterium sp.]